MNFRPFRSEDTQSTIKLLNLCFLGQNITKESFLWKHFDDFFEGKTVAFVAQKSDLIVGFVCFTPFKILNSGIVQTAWVCAVQACHQDFRRRGIVKELTLECEKIIGNNEIYIGFSNASGVKIDQNSKSINYQIVRQMQQTVLLPNFNKHHSVILNSIQNLKDINIKINPNLICSSSFKNTIQFSYSPQFINWRYVNNPKVKYQYLEVKIKDILCATAIIHKTNYFVEVDQIIFYDQNNAKEILQSITNHFFQRKFKLTKIQYLPNQFWNNILPTIKFTKKLETYLTIKSSNLGLISASNWIIIGGDVL
jgi:Acetyltransferase (GNAT) domain